MNTKKDKIYALGIGIVSLTFYLFFAFYDGAVICADSPSYINMSLTREFLYPAILAVFRFLFGEQYLLYVVIMQSVISAFAAWKITIYLRNKFSLGYIMSTMIFIIPILVSLLNRFVAKRGIMYSNSILTEGLAIPLFLVFICYLYDYLADNSQKSLVNAIILSGILVSLRKQMYVTLVLLFAVILFVQLTSKEKSDKNRMKKWMSGVCKAVVVCVAILLTFTLLDHSFNYIVRGRFVGHSSDSRFVLTMAFYTSEEEYVTELPEEIQPLFLNIYKTCDEQGYLMNSADDGWYNNVSHFENNYDLIQINTMWPAIHEFVEENYSDDFTDRELITDEITNEMIVSLLPKTAPKILKVLSNNFLAGLVTTVAKQSRVLTYYTAFAYLVYVLLLGIYWKKRRKMDDTVKLCLLSLLSIVVNVGLVSAVIFCQTRYTIYNMAVFYCSLCVLLYKAKEIIQGRKK